MATNTQEVITRVFLDGTNAEKHIKELEDKAKKFRQEYEKAFKNNDFKGMSKAQKAIKDCEKQAKSFRTSAQEVNRVLSDLSTAGVKDLERTIKAINAELASGRVKRGSEDWNVLLEELKRCKQELAGIKAESAAIAQQGFFSRTADFLNKQWFVITSAIQSLTGLSTTIRKCISDFAEMDAEMANVRKFTGMTEGEVRRLNDEFHKIDTRSSRIELNRLAEEAGKLGMQSQKDVLGFVRAADQINVALDELGEGATLTISKLTNIFGDAQRMGVEESMLSVGSVINELSQNCTASASYMAEFGKRMAGVGAQANMTIPQIMAFASVLDSQGQAVEMSATALSQLIMKLYKDPAKIAKAAGLQVTEFTNLLKKDANEALLVLLQRLHDFGSDDGLAVIAPIFKDMGADGARASGVLAALAANIDMVRKQQVEANKAFEDGTSVTKEFEVQNNTVEAGLEKAKKQFFEVSVALGEKLQPIAKYTINTFSSFMKVLNVLIEYVTTHKRLVVTTTSAIAAFTAAVYAKMVAQKMELALTKGIEFLYRSLRVAYLTASVAVNTLRRRTEAAAAAQTALNASIKANPYLLLVAAVVSAGVAIYNYRKHVEEEEKAARKAAKANEKYRKSLTDIEKSSKEYSDSELDNAKTLYEAAINESIARENRIEAVKKLQEFYPDYFGNMSIEDVMLGRAITQYEELTKSIINYAKAKAAAGKITENEKAILDLETEIEEKRERAIEASDKADWAEKEAKREKDKSKDDPYGHINMQKVFDAEIFRKQHKEAQAELDDALAKKEELVKANEELAEKYAVSDMKLKELIGTPTVIPTTPRTLSDEELRKQQKARKEADEKERAALELQLTEMARLYSVGEKDYFVYQDEIYQTTKKSLENRQSIWGKETKEYADIARQLQDLEDKRTESQRDRTLQELEREHQLKMGYIRASLDEEGNYIQRTEEEINEALFQENMEYLRLKQGNYHKYSQKWYELQAQMDEAREREKLRKADAYQKLLQKYREQWENTDLQKQQEVAINGLDELHRQGLVSEEEFQRMRLAIIREFSLKAVEQVRDEREKGVSDALKLARSKVGEKKGSIADSNLSDAGIGGQIAGIAVTIQNYRTMYEEIERMREDDEISEQDATDAKRQLNNQLFSDVAAYAQTAYNSISQIVNAAAAYSKACSDYEVASITANYEKQIAAAGKNNKKKEKLEKERDEKIRAAKNKANDKAMKIELAQAIASTAMAAINAYSSAAQVPMVGYILGPIAAAAAIAAGAFQIATIKKQHAAEALGYYSGGFTGGRRYRKEAGVVHEGEFVANHQAVNNPNLLPFFEFVDQAQKNNTVSSLTHEDVRSVTGGGGSVIAPIVNVTTDNSELHDAILGMNESIARLNAELEAGINAPILLDGENGLMKKMYRYNKLNAGV